ncbi:MAG: restriction endonuclease subunit S [Treponema sp.]|nr:restriction endonuclease subunit S [Treponema sp.]
MKGYRKIGDLVDLIDERNKDEKVKTLIGVSIDKCFIKSVANTIGTDLSKYQVIRKFDFACSLMQVSRDGKIPIACLKDYDEAIMSPAYYIFRIKNTEEILPDYMAMWFMRPEFDREASYIAVGGVRGSMPWEDFCDMKLPVPPLNEQQKIVDTYNAITNRIQIKQKINENLEKTAQCLFEKMWKSEDSIEVELSELSELTSSKRVFFDEYVPEGVPFYRGGEITEKRNGKQISDPLFITEESYEEKIEKYGVPHAGDILITAVGTIGNSYMVTENDKFYFKDGNLIWFKNFKEDSNYLIYDFLNSKQFKNKIEQISIGSTQTALTISGLSKIKTKIPSENSRDLYIKKSKSIQFSITFNNEELSKLYSLRDIVVSQISKR